MIEHQRTIVCFRMLPIENLIQSYKDVAHQYRIIINKHLPFDSTCISRCVSMYICTFLIILYLKAHKCN